MRRYFSEITARLREKEPRFYFYAALSQWKYFFNDFVHIQNRGWDLWQLGRIARLAFFITLPVEITETSSLMSCRARWPCCEARRRKRILSARCFSAAT